MPKTREASVRWVPKTDADCKRVQQELDAILASSHFRNSKRYPLLLRYVVEKTLEGESDTLKERTLGVEVFERRPDYDTNADPVVRFSASEIRKKLAQYYHENEELSLLQIELPLGSYVPDFRVDTAHSRVPDEAASSSGRIHFEPLITSPAPQANIAARADIAPLPLVSTDSKPARPTSRRFAFLALLAVLVVAFGLAGYSLRHRRNSAMEGLWNPLIQSSGPVLFVVGSGSLELTSPEPPETTLFNHMIGPYHHLSVASAVAISRLASTLEVQNKHYFVKEAPSTSLIDIRERSVVVVEGLNNAWTLRLTDPLRFRFVHGPLARIEDRENPLNLDWTLDFSQPYGSVARDYGIVARYFDSKTNGNVMVVAGLGPYGTQAASELVSSPAYLKQLDNQLPLGWQSHNIELVVKTDVIDGEAGPPQVIAHTGW